MSDKEHDKFNTNIISFANCQKMEKKILKVIKVLKRYQKKKVRMQCLITETNQDISSELINGEI